MKKRKNTLRPLWDELESRLYKPTLSVSFWVFLGLGIVVFGGLAIWLEILKYVAADQSHKSIEGIRLAILTYFPAIGCAAGQQLAVYEEKRAYVKNFGYAVSIGFFLFCMILFFLQEKYPVGILVLGILASALAVLAAWIAIGHDTPFDEEDLSAPVGGDSRAELNGDAGGFNI
jgi:hypothetical protein